MERLRQRILVEGKDLGRSILKVDSFINHQIDTHLMFDVGRELARRFADAGVTKVMTAEISGIAPALATAHALNVPIIYARKTRPVTMTGPVFVEVAPSHTKGRDVFLMVSTEFLRPGDRVLVVDDFLASGATIAALVRLIEDASATLVGIGTAIEKRFEGGREATGLYPLGRPIERVPAWGAGTAGLRAGTGRAGPRHLLRDATAGSPPRWPSGPHPQAGIRTRAGSGVDE